MPKYNSSKNAWPTKNLFIGGGPSRPLNRISITVTKPKTKFAIGPTVKAANKLPSRNDRILQTPKMTGWKALKLVFTTTQESLNALEKEMQPKIKPQKKRKTIYDPKYSGAQQ